MNSQAVLITREKTCNLVKLSFPVLFKFISMLGIGELTQPELPE